MKVYVAIIIFSILSEYIFIQKEIKTSPISAKELVGVYEGYTSQDMGNNEVFYKTIFKLKIDKNQNIKGQSTFYADNDNIQILVVYNLEGSYNAAEQNVR